MIELKLHRKNYTDKQTTGIMEVYQDGMFKFVLSTLELDWNGNSVSSSCIPKGSYNVEHYSSEKYPNTFELQKVPNRSKILIHSGNYYTHTKGCILVGFIHEDINKDRSADVKYSVKALDKLRKLCKDETEINIIIT